VIAIDTNPPKTVLFFKSVSKWNLSGNGSDMLSFSLTKFMHDL
jgi:hypothetical protein